jgi:uncharacterized protein YbaR (Trm112 family)
MLNESLQHFTGARVPHMPFPDDIGVQLACPKCRTALARDGDSFVCSSAECRLRYAIADDIPKFLIEEAEEVPPDEWKRIVCGRDGAERN